MKRNQELASLLRDKARGLPDSNRYRFALFAAAKGADSHPAAILSFTEAGQAKGVGPTVLEKAPAQPDAHMRNPQEAQDNADRQAYPSDRSGKGGTAANGTGGFETISILSSGWRNVIRQLRKFEAITSL